MGYWVETCILTNLPIIGDGDVVALTAETEKKFLFYLWSPWFTKINVAIGKLNDYGELEEITESNLEKPENEFKFNDDGKFISFCYKDVYDKVVERAKKNSDLKDKWLNYRKDFDINKSNISKVHEDLFFLLWALIKGRAGFPSNLQRGRQDTDINFRRYLAELTIQKAGEIEEYIEDQ